VFTCIYSGSKTIIIRTVYALGRLLIVIFYCRVQECKCEQLKIPALIKIGTVESRWSQPFSHKQSVRQLYREWI